MWQCRVNRILALSPLQFFLIEATYSIARIINLAAKGITPDRNGITTTTTITATTTAVAATKQLGER